MYKRQIPAAMAGFLSHQQFAVLSSADKDGRVWASLVAGAPGMIAVRGSNTIALVRANVGTELPLSDVLANPQVGLIAIDFSRRIRVRVNGHASVDPDGSLTIAVDQLYGNCSQYIQKRIVEGASDQSANFSVMPGEMLSDSQRELIERADTFFIASRHPELGADASHRGGKPGFVQVTSPTTLSFPDYSGNNMFNTLGNLAVNPAVGLLFVDFASGRTLQVSGRAAVDWDRGRTTQVDDKAQRVIDVEIHAVREVEHAMSLRYRFIGYSPTLG